jgi:hypothetical protein
MKKIKKIDRRGGYREGAGRPKGSQNKKTIALRMAIEQMAIAGEQPLEVMLSVMRNPDLPPMLRFDAACKAAPYCHPKLASVAQKGKVDLGLAARLEAAMKRVDAEHINGKGRAASDLARH